MTSQAAAAISDDAERVGPDVCVQRVARRRAEGGLGGRRDGARATAAGPRSERYGRRRRRRVPVSSTPACHNGRERHECTCRANSRGAPCLSFHRASLPALSVRALRIHLETTACSTTPSRTLQPVGVGISSGIARAESVSVERANESGCANFFEDSNPFGRFALTLLLLTLLLQAQHTRHLHCRARHDRFLLAGRCAVRVHTRASMPRQRTPEAAPALHVPAARSHTNTHTHNDNAKKNRSSNTICVRVQAMTSTPATY